MAASLQISICDCQCFLNILPLRKTSEFPDNTESSGQKTAISFSRPLRLLFFCLMETNYDSIVLYLLHWIIMFFNTGCKKDLLFFLFLNTSIILRLRTILYLPFSLFWYLFCFQVVCTMEGVFHHLRPVLSGLIF